jgi:hypothetical protein
LEQRNARRVQVTLLPWIVRIEQAISQLLRNPQHMKFNVDGLLRGSTESRFAAHSQSLLAGWSTVNEVRRLEDRPAFDNQAANMPRVPLANVNLDAADVVDLDKRVAMAQKLVVSGYEPEAVLRALDLPAIPHTGLPSVQLQPAPDGTI